MDVRFESNDNMDLILNLDGEPHNLGYGHLAKMPVALWLAYAQIGCGNLFQKVKIPPIKGDLPAHSLEKIIDDAKGIARELPLPSEEFELRMEAARLSFFRGGTKRTEYQLKVDQSKKLELHYYGQNSHYPKLIFSLASNEIKSLVESYFDFFHKNKQFEKSRIEVRIVYNQLREFSRPKPNLVR